MIFTQTKIPDVVLIKPQKFEDERGWFMESFNQQKFEQGLRQLGLPIPKSFVQDNHSCSKKGVLRGLHYQLPPHAQGKLVRVTKGAAFDVAVDIRKNSPTFGEWVGATLTEQNNDMLWIPEGFAHGFVALEDDTHFHYKTTDFYARDSEAAIIWNDESLGIDWPASLEFELSSKDNEAPLLAQARLFE